MKRLSLSMVVYRFESNHFHTEKGKFVVPLPKDPSAKLIGESMITSCTEILCLERSLNTRGCFKGFNDITQ